MLHGLGDSAGELLVCRQKACALSCCSSVSNTILCRSAHSTCPTDPNTQGHTQTLTTSLRPSALLSSKPAASCSPQHPLRYRESNKSPRPSKRWRALLWSPSLKLHTLVHVRRTLKCVCDDRTAQQLNELRRRVDPLVATCPIESCVEGYTSWFLADLYPARTLCALGGATWPFVAGRFFFGTRHRVKKKRTHTQHLSIAFRGGI